MNIKKGINFAFLITSFVLITASCQNADKKQSTINTNQSQTVIDTSLWLKETRGIRDILEDRRGNLWFSSPDYVAKFDGQSMYYFSKNDGLSITGNIQEDDNGTVWIENGFRAFRYDDASFSEERIDNIKGSNGLWIQRGLKPTDTTYVKPGLYEVKHKTTDFFPLPINEDVNNKYLYFPTTKAFLGNDSTVWIGTMEKVYGFKNNSFISIGREEMGRRDDARQIGIRGIFVDSQGKLWIADNGTGVFVYDGEKTENFTRKHNLEEGDTEGRTLHRAFSIAEDNKGNMWFGTVYSGIWMYSPKTKLFKNYAKNEGVTSDNIWTIYKTKKGDLLFAGESPAAVYTFNGKTFDRKY